MMQKEFCKKAESNGRVKGRLEMCLELVKDGRLTFAEAAKRLNMNEEELKTYFK